MWSTSVTVAINGESIAGASLYICIVVMADRVVCAIEVSLNDWDNALDSEGRVIGRISLRSQIFNGVNIMMPDTVLRHMHHRVSKLRHGRHYGLCCLGASHTRTLEKTGHKCATMSSEAICCPTHMYAGTLCGRAMYNVLCERAQTMGEDDALYTRFEQIKIDIGVHVKHYEDDIAHFHVVWQPRTLPAQTECTPSIRERGIQIWNY